MSTLMIALCAPLSLLTADATGYAEAHRVMEETGKPLMVMVSTEWCVPCQNMKKNVIPQVQQRGALRKVAFAMVNPDQEHELAQKIAGGGAVPQLIMFRRTAHGWNRQVLVGGQSVERVEQFINDAVTANEAEKDVKQASVKTGTADDQQEDPHT